MDDPWVIRLVERDGATRCEVSGRDGWVEPVCPSCGEGIRWVLDMLSFVRNDMGGFTMSHARCAWTPGGFDRERALSAALEVASR